MPAKAAQNQKSTDKVAVAPAKRIKSKQPTKDLFAVPMNASGSGGITPAELTETATGDESISITNTDPIDGGSGTAIDATAEEGDIVVDNSGDITGVNGIVVSTSTDLSLEGAEYSETHWTTERSTWLWDYGWNISRPG